MDYKYVFKIKKGIQAKVVLYSYRTPHIHTYVTVPMHPFVRILARKRGRCKRHNLVHRKNPWIMHGNKRDTYTALLAVTAMASANVNAEFEARRSAGPKSNRSTHTYIYIYAYTHTHTQTHTHTHTHTHSNSRFTAWQNAAENKAMRSPNLLPLSRTGGGSGGGKGAPKSGGKEDAPAHCRRAMKYGNTFRQQSTLLKTTYSLYGLLLAQDPITEPKQHKTDLQPITASNHRTVFLLP